MPTKNTQGIFTEAMVALSSAGFLRRRQLSFMGLSTPIRQDDMGASTLWELLVHHNLAWRARGRTVTDTTLVPVRTWISAYAVQDDVVARTSELLLPAVTLELPLTGKLGSPLLVDEGPLEGRAYLDGVHREAGSAIVHDLGQRDGRTYRRSAKAALQLTRPIFALARDLDCQSSTLTIAPYRALSYPSCL